MALQKIDVTQDFPIPVENLFAWMSEQENMGKLFAPAKVTRLRDGKDSRNGVGSARLVKMPLAPVIEETNTLVGENERIEYRVTNRTIITNHMGVMEFSRVGTGSRLHYTITFESRVPGTGWLIRVMLDHAIRKGLQQVA